MDNLSYALLDEDAVKMGLASLADWSIENNILTKTYSFESYAEGIMFGAAVGHLANTLDHHPDILISYGKVKVSTWTHDAGGLTSYDLELAKRIDRIV